MSETPVKIVVNCETGEQEIVPLTAEEIAQREADAAAAEAERLAREAEEQAKAEKKAAVLAALAAASGLTAEEIAEALA